ncbi:H-2 class II histocompatibility antigen, A-U alpha chain-like [Acanthochromis polyacanthus]|uniref:H-2 class II histocompatibility antigen, A-U alpha chain-like n=1 Tax=Acanthochromis polyacanthus TaxID=80966 RepID=A0A3Q1F866_9TELE|nr:H-2 class II histocompatibility antigen, A-U alpha chain-like [Acanthochromis polyacanthus]
MDLSLVSLLVFIVCSAQTAVHEVSMFYGCFDSADCQVQFHLDGDQIAYADFKEQRAVWTAALIPEQVEVLEGFYVLAVVSRDRLYKRYLHEAEQIETSPSEDKAPTVFLYPMEEAEEGKDNTLFCYISHYYPPSINVTWTINGVEVMEGRTLSNLLPEQDGTFSQLAGLSVRPQPDQVLECSVKHRALSQPAVRTWVLPGKPAGSAAPVCLVLGLVCLFLGIIIFIISAHDSLRCQLSSYWQTAYLRVAGLNQQT